LKLNLKKYLNEVKKAINEHGIKAAQEKITEKLGSWEHVDVRLAVIGTTGSGKSSFINTVRGYANNQCYWRDQRPGYLTFCFLCWFLPFPAWFILAKKI
jgi:ribosome biogenesis GTPase A